MIKLTREARLQQLAKETKTGLEQLNRLELQTLANGLITRYSKLTKANLIDKLLEVSDGYRTDLKAQSLEFVELNTDADFGYEFYLNAYQKNKDTKPLVEYMVNTWKGKGIAQTTLVKSKPKQVKNCLDLLVSNFPDSLEWTDLLYSELRILLQNDNKVVNKEYGQKVEGYGTPETMLEIDGSVVVNWSEKVLTDYINNPNPDKDWQGVSLALALTSGRRMDEIHGTCRFFAVSDNNLKSVGLSKKSDEDSVLISPCLVDNQLWLYAYNRLPEKRKGLNNIKVNQNISKLVSDSLKTKIYPDLGINQYKDSRDFFVAYLIKNVWDVDKHGSQLNYAKNLLGHDSKKITLSYEKIKVI
jgi:hypothetical protein